MDFPSAVINGGMTLAMGEWQHRDGVGLMYRPRTEEERTALLSGALVARVPVATTLLDMEVRCLLLRVACFGLKYATNYCIRFLV